MADVDLSIGEPGEPEVTDDVGAGVPFDDPAPPLGDPFVDELAPEAPPVDELTVRGLMASCGGVLHTVAGDPDVEDHWRFTPGEVDQIAPPLTRWINRQPRLRRAVAHGDEVAVAVALAGYIGRNLADQQTANRNRDKDSPDGDEPREDRPSPSAADAQGGGPPHGGPRRHGGNDGRIVSAPAGGRVAR